MENEGLYDRNLLPLIILDEELLRLRNVGFREVDVAKQKIVETVQNYFLIFDKIKLSSLDAGLLHDLRGSLTDQGIIGGSSAFFKEGLVYLLTSCIFSRKDPTKKGCLTSENFCLLLPSEIWQLVFEFLDWKTFCDLHLVSKTIQKALKSIKSGCKLIRFLQASPTPENDFPTFTILPTLTWRGSADVSWMKVAIPNIEKELEDQAKRSDPQPIFVPMLGGRELQQKITSLKKKRWYSNTGVAFSEIVWRFEVVYVEQMDQFLIVRVVTQRAGCMGINDTRSQEETFYTFGDTAEIFLPHGTRWSTRAIEFFHAVCAACQIGYYYLINSILICKDGE